MLFDELQEQLKSLQPDITIIKNYWAKSSHESRYDQLEQQINQEEFWKNPDQAEILKEFQSLKELRGDASRRSS